MDNGVISRAAVSFTFSGLHWISLGKAAYLSELSRLAIIGHIDSLLLMNV